jgi:hypothetical protein
MDADRFDALARALHTTPTRRLTLRALTALGLAAVLGEAEIEAEPKGGGKKGGKKKGKCKGKGKDKVTICHKGQTTMQVSRCALKRHQKHGDREGACPGGDPPPPFCASQPNGSVCQGSPNGALRCCNGACPATPTCLPGGTPCTEGDTCAQCCAEATVKTFPDEEVFCGANGPDGDPNVCATDVDCDSGVEASPAWCVCSKCCLSPGTLLADTAFLTCEHCCNGCAPGDTTCA